MDDRERAFLEAAMPHLDVVYRVARHTSRDHHQAEDLVQETYLRAFAAFASHRGPSTKAWLVTICLNLARSEGRRRARRAVETSLPEHYEPAAPGVNVPEEALAKMVATSARPFPVPSMSHLLTGSSPHAWMATKGRLSMYGVNRRGGGESMFVVAAMPMAEMPQMAAHLGLI